jgi:hypothetical protein
MSSLGICQEPMLNKGVGLGGLFPAAPWIFHLKDDVTVILLIGFSFTHTVGVILLIVTKYPLFTEKHFRLQN